MALTIATISLCIFIILIQHLLNWAFRKIIDIMEEHSIALIIPLSTFSLGITFLLFRTIIQLNK